jgi:putative transcriptional regulator
VVLAKVSLSNNLKVQRAIRNLTQEQLARKVGVTRKTINTIEKGRYIPSGYLMLKIAGEFGLPVEEIFRLNDGSKENTDNDSGFVVKFPLSG